MVEVVCICFASCLCLPFFVWRCFRSMLRVCRIGVGRRRLLSCFLSSSEVGEFYFGLVSFTLFSLGEILLLFGDMYALFLLFY